MKYSAFIISLLLFTACASLSHNKQDGFCVKLGQEWRYDTREHEQDSRLFIVDAFINKKKQRFYVVRVTGVKIDNPKFLNYFPDEIPFFIISEKGLNESLVSLVGEGSWNKYFDQNYENWKRNLRNPDYLGGTIKKKLEMLEEILDTRVGA